MPFLCRLLEWLSPKDHCLSSLYTDPWSTGKPLEWKRCDTCWRALSRLYSILQESAALWKDSWDRDQDHTLRLLDKWNTLYQLQGQQLPCRRCWTLLWPQWLGRPSLIHSPRNPQNLGLSCHESWRISLKTLLAQPWPHSHAFDCCVAKWKRRSTPECVRSSHKWYCWSLILYASSRSQKKVEMSLKSFFSPLRLDAVPS